MSDGFSHCVEVQTSKFILCDVLLWLETYDTLQMFVKEFMSPDAFDCIIEELEPYR